MTSHFIVLSILDKVLKKYFFGVPHLATCIFLFFYNEPELGVGIDPGMALTSLPSSIGQGSNPWPSDREPSALLLDHSFGLSWTKLIYCIVWYGFLAEQNEVFTFESLLITFEAGNIFRQQKNLTWAQNQTVLDCEKNVLLTYFYFKIFKKCLISETSEKG